MTQVLAGVSGSRISVMSWPGPYATHLLRLLGAEVIKIEAPGRGDAMRDYGADRRYDGMAPAFIAVNAGKKSIVARSEGRRGQLATARAHRRALRRAGGELPPGRHGAARPGLRCGRVLLNPGIVYCSVSGYGQSGPRRDWPAIDNIVQATSGMMSLGGDPGDRADARRLSGGRHADRPDRGLRDPRRAVAARAQRRR